MPNLTNQKRYKESEYHEKFPNNIREKALNVALDIRKFEIELYWKRASYFWTLIGATLLGFGAAQQTKSHLSVVIACLGLLFSFAWFCFNKGSKNWQMNWEKHVDMLEDYEIGPLYKINWLTDPSEQSNNRGLKAFLIEGDRYSVTRINQLVSFFVVIVWVALLIYAFIVDNHLIAIALSRATSIVLDFISVLLTFTFVVLILTYGRSGRGRPFKLFKMRSSLPRNHESGSKAE